MNGNPTLIRKEQKMKKKLTPGEFNNIVKFLKRLDDIGDDFFLYGDVICPSVRVKENFPGMHLVRADLPLFGEFENVIYAMFKINETSTDMGNVKGKKILIEYEQTERGIWITLNDNVWQLAGTYSPDVIDENGRTQAEIAETLCPKSNKFDSYMDSVEWSEIPTDTINIIKNGSICTLEDERKTTYVRFGRDALKLKGATRKDMPAKFSLDVSIQSPLSSEDTLVVSTVSGGMDSGTLMLHMLDPVIECIHYYKYSPFK